MKRKINYNSFINCPICGKLVSSLTINSHIDSNCDKNHDFNEKINSSESEIENFNYSQKNDIPIDIFSQDSIGKNSPNDIIQIENENENNLNGDNKINCIVNSGNEIDNDYKRIDKNVLNSPNKQISNSINNRNVLNSPNKQIKLTNSPSQYTSFKKANEIKKVEFYKPLYERVRPKTFDELCGHDKLFGNNGNLIELIKKDKIPSMILWGPPGCGKTTIAKIISKMTSKQFIKLSGVDSGIKDIEEVIEISKNEKLLRKRETILFIDEIHRYNKRQQDIFLPYIENGTFILIGATTENPSFSLNNALLSRCRVEKLESLKEDDIKDIIKRILKEYMNNLKIDDDGLNILSKLSNGDARKSINILEQIEMEGIKDKEEIKKDDILKIIKSNKLFYDKDGDYHYDTISAFHKSLVYLFYFI